MTSAEAMIYQLKNLKGKPLKQKLEHIFTYYWIPILVVAATLCFTVAYVVHLATVKDPGLTITCINAYAQPDQAEAYMTEFARKADIDLDQYEVRLSTELYISDENLMESYDTLQVLGAYIAAQDLDMLVSNPQTLCPFIYQDTFTDLTQMLTPEQQAQYGEYYLYVDLAVLKELETVTETVTEYPDPSKPELMEEPVPVALLLPENSSFRQLFYFQTAGDVAIGILGNTLNTNNALAFLDYIME